MVPAAIEGASELRSLVAQGAAAYMVRIVRDGMIVAVVLSRRIGEVSRRIVGVVEGRRCATFDSLAGSVRGGNGTGGSPYEVAGFLGNAFVTNRRVNYWTRAEALPGVWRMPVGCYPSLSWSFGMRWNRVLKGLRGVWCKRRPQAIDNGR